MKNDSTCRNETFTTCFPKIHWKSLKSLHRQQQENSPSIWSRLYLNYKKSKMSTAWVLCLAENYAPILYSGFLKHFPWIYLVSLCSEKRKPRNDTFHIAGSFLLLKHDRPTDFNVCIQGQIHVADIAFTYSVLLLLPSLRWKLFRWVICVFPKFKKNNK